MRRTGWAKSLKIVSTVLAAALAAGCAPRQTTDNYVTLNGFALGTTYKFIVNTPDSSGLRHSIDSLMEVMNGSLSVHNPASLISRLNRNETDSVDTHIARNIETAREFSELSDGAYDITAKPVIQALGFAGGENTGAFDLDSLMRFVGYEKIRVDKGRLVKENPGIQIDFSSIAKGYTVDMVGELMAGYGAKDYLIEIGGEICCKGKSPRGDYWKVGVAKPIDGNIMPGQAVQTKISISEGGMATSGNYRQYYLDDQGRKVTHIINAKTGQARQTDVLSATVIAANAMTADALATVCMTVGLERSIEILKANPRWMGYLVFDDGKDGFATYTTDNMKARIAP